MKRAVHACIAAALTMILGAVTASGQEPAGAMSEARAAAAHRQRRIIFNNDGDDAWLTTAPKTPEGFLSVRMDHVGDCGVDSVFYCTTQSINLFTQDSPVTEIFTATSSSFANNRVAALIEQGTDPVKLAVQACRKNGIEIIWTMRMNDIHDNWTSEFFSEWKKQHPELLVGTPQDRQKYPDSDGRNVYTYADFAHTEVRDLMVVIFRDVLARYDLDGVDMDFLRHTCYFKETRLHQPVTREHMDMLTDMVADIRREVLEASRRRGRPLLLSARVFPTLALNRRFGFDVERWMKDDLVDFVAVGGGYDPFTMPVSDMIERGHAANMPVYVCLSSSGMIQRGVSDSELSGGSVPAWRAAAANAWHAGADGIMTFNLFPSLPDTNATRTARTQWREMSDPGALAGKTKLYAVEHLDHSRTLGYMLRSVPWEGRLPVPVPRGKTVVRRLPVADDVQALRNQLETLRLRLALGGLKAGYKLTVTVNGRTVPAAPEKPAWLAADLDPDCLRQGDNAIAVTYEAGEAAALKLQSVELKIAYR